MQETLQKFVDWTKRKIKHHFEESEKLVYFYEREIWWAAMGQNIGFETNGKNEYFSRPVLVIKKYSAHMCFVLPLTTQIKAENPPYQYVVELNGISSAINLSQGRTISSGRLFQKMGKIDTQIYDEIVNKFVALLTKK